MYCAALNGLTFHMRTSYILFNLFCSTHLRLFHVKECIALVCPFSLLHINYFYENALIIGIPIVDIMMVRVFLFLKQLCCEYFHMHFLLYR